MFYWMDQASAEAALSFREQVRECRSPPAEAVAAARKPALAWSASRPAAHPEAHFQRSVLNFGSLGCAFDDLEAPITAIGSFLKSWAMPPVSYPLSPIFCD